MNTLRSQAHRPAPYRRDIRRRALVVQDGLRKIGIQDIINKDLAVIVDWMNIMTNPIWIIDNQSGVDPEMLTNQIGLIVSKNQGTEVRRESAPPLPSEMFNFYQVLQTLADQASGINDVTQGRRPTGITAAEALQTMQEAAQTRIRLKERNLQVSLSRLGELVISRMMQFYTKPRVIRLVGDGAEWPSYIEWYVEDTDEGSTMTSRKYEFDQESKSYVQPDDWNTSEPSRGIFDVQVVGGTSLPFLREKRGSLAMKLYEQQVIDKESLLDTLDWPKKDQVLRRGMEAEAAAQQAQPAPGPGQVIQGAQQ